MWLIYLYYTRGYHTKYQVIDDQDEIRFASAVGNISQIPEVGLFKYIPEICTSHYCY